MQFLESGLQQEKRLAPYWVVSIYHDAGTKSIWHTTES